MSIIGKTEEFLFLRISFIFTGAFLLYAGFQNWIKGDLYIHPEIVILCLITYILSFVFFILALIHVQDLSKFRHLLLPSLIFIIVFTVYVTSEIFYNGIYRTDAIALTHYAAIKFIESGANPYVLDLREALMMFPIDPEYITFTATGDLITSLNYPALHFLIYIPFIKLGLTDMRWVTIIFIILVIILLYCKAPQKVRPLVLLPLFAGADLVINFPAGTVTDFLWILPLVFSILYINNTVLSSVSFGLACAIKQEPWLLAPFLLIWVWKETKGSIKIKFQRVGLFIGLSFFSFILPNLRFIIDDPSAWWRGVTNPFFGDLIVQSQGLSMITQMGYVPLSRTFFMITTILVYLFLIFNYGVYYDKLRYTFWIYPAIVLWFSYRGLQSYFIHLIPVVLAASLTWYNEMRRNKR